MENCKTCQINGIVFAKDEQTLGIGSGQTSRVDSSEIAVSKAAKEQLGLIGSTISDAFFPFSDGIEAAANAGATAVIQPEVVFGIKRVSIKQMS